MILFDFREEKNARIQQRKEEEYESGKIVREQTEKKKTAQWENVVQSLKVRGQLASYPGRGLGTRLGDNMTLTRGPPHLPLSIMAK